MPINWIVRPHHETIPDFGLQFVCKAHPSSGYMLDCDKDGSVIPNAYATLAERQAQLAGLKADEAYDGPYFVDMTLQWFNPGSLRCHCGAEHHLARGDSTCECGQWFNACGQELQPPHMWEERYEDDY